MVDGWLFSGQNHDFTLYTALYIYLYMLLESELSLTKTKAIKKLKIKIYKLINNTNILFFIILSTKLTKLETI